MNKRNTKGTVVWCAFLIIYVAILAIPTSREVFNTLNLEHPYILGFINFAILSTMGELLAIRIKEGTWRMSIGVQWKAIVWGCIGILITFVFQIFSGGIAFAIETGFLPNVTNSVLIALLTSASMNILFAPTFMMAHRITETYIDLKYEFTGKVHLKDVVEAIDWNGLVSFVYIKTIPLFWIPAHTIAFLLPMEYRVVMAAGLSIVLGLILSFGKK